jgi:hypothetical protein
MLNGALYSEKRFIFVLETSQVISIKIKSYYLYVLII